MKKALIVYGGWPGHEPEKCTEILTEMLEPDGYEVRAEYQTSAFAEDYVHDMDLIIPLVTMAFHFDPRGEIKKNGRRPRVLIKKMKKIIRPRIQ